MKKETLKYDKIVIGSTLEGLLYAYLHGLPLFYAVAKTPTDFETLDIDDNFWGSLDHENISTTIKTNKGEITIGSSKLEVWNKLFFSLSMAGLIPCTNVQSLRIDDELVKITTKNNRLIKIQPKNILLFDDEGVEGLTRAYKTNKRLIVYDWIIFHHFMLNFDFTMVQTEWDYCNKLWFLNPLDAHRPCDACLVSYVSGQTELQNDLTDYILRFTLKNIFKEHNMKGSLNGFRPNGAQNYRPVSYEFVARQVVKEKPHLYYDWDNVKSMTHLTIEDILKDKNNTNYVMYKTCSKLTQKTGQIKEVFISQV
jgi:hypothetical protein